MTELGRRLLPAVAVVSVALVVMLATGSPDRDIAVRLWLVALGVIAGWAVVTAAWAGADGGRDRYERATADVAVVARPERAALRQAGRTVTHAGGTAGDLHFRARPVLRDIARARLADRGIDLDAPEHAAEAAHRCGPVLWDVVRPDRRAPDDRHRPGLRRSDVPDLVGRLESL